MTKHTLILLSAAFALSACGGSGSSSAIDDGNGTDSGNPAAVDNTGDAGTSGGDTGTSVGDAGTSVGDAGTSSGDTASTTGKFSLSVTDAPVDDADAVVVTFSQVELIGEDGNVETISLDPAASIDLLAQQGDSSAPLVTGESVPVGVYSRLRLLVESAPSNCKNLSSELDSYITIDGTDYPLTVPSGSKSGLLVKGPLTIGAGGSVSYTIDFDLRKSIAARGKSSCYSLRPVLRLVDNAEVGTLTGSVDSALLEQSQCEADTVTGAGAAVYVFAGDTVPDDLDGDEGDALTTANLTATESGFEYTVGFLPAGDYTAAFSCQAGNDDPQADDTLEFVGTTGVVVESSATATVDFTLEPAPTGSAGATAR